MCFLILVGIVIYALQSSLGSVTTGDTGNHVNLTLLEHIHLGFIYQLDVGNGCDGSFAAEAVTGIYGVELQGSGVGIVIIVADHIRTGIRQCRIPLHVCNDLAGNLVGFRAVLGHFCIECIVQTASLGCLIDNDRTLGAEVER